jgi:hypothetical protein
METETEDCFTEMNETLARCFVYMFFYNLDKKTQSISISDIIQL